MIPSDLRVRVVGVISSCPVYRTGQEFFIRRGYILDPPDSSSVCMHSLASIMPYYVALSRGIAPDSLGLAGPEPGCAYVQCLDPCDLTGGGTARFEIRPVRIEAE